MLTIVFINPNVKIRVSLSRPISMKKVKRCLIKVIGGWCGDDQNKRRIMSH